MLKNVVACLATRPQLPNGTTQETVAVAELVSTGIRTSNDDTGRSFDQ